jgi:hypothetical protein
MKAPKAILSLVFFVTACGGQEVSTKQAAEPPAPAKAKRADSRRAAPAQPAGVPCAPLQAKMVRYDTAGKPFYFSFEMPEGFTVKEFHAGTVSHVDVTRNVDGKGIDEYVLRLMQNSKVQENPERAPDTWKKLPSTEAVLAKEVDGRTMYISRSRIGEMVNFQGLFPAFDSPSGAHFVMGGVTSAPKPCRTQAGEMVERMLMSFERNPRVGEIPAR